MGAVTWVVLKVCYPEKIKCWFSHIPLTHSDFGENAFHNALGNQTWLFSLQDLTRKGASIPPPLNTCPPYVKSKSGFVERSPLIRQQENTVKLPGPQATFLIQDRKYKLCTKHRLETIKFTH